VPGQHPAATIPPEQGAHPSRVTTSDSDDSSLFCRLHAGELGPYRQGLCTLDWSRKQRANSVCCVGRTTC
jgi:hypothetical protein